MKVCRIWHILSTSNGACSLLLQVWSQKFWWIRGLVFHEHSASNIDPRCFMFFEFGGQVFSILNRPTDLMAWIVAPKFCASILSSLKQQFRISRDDGDYWLSSTLFTWWKQRVTRFQINEAANSRQKPNSRPSVENTLIFALPGKLKARHSLSRPFGLSESFNNIIAEEYPSNPTLTTRLLHLELIQGESRWYANAYTQPSVRNKRLVLRFGQLALGSTIRRGYEYPYPQLQHSNDHISTRL